MTTRTVIRTEGRGEVEKKKKKSKTLSLSVRRPISRLSRLSAHHPPLNHAARPGPPPLRHPPRRPSGRRRGAGRDQGAGEFEMEMREKRAPTAREGGEWAFFLLLPPARNPSRDRGRERGRSR